MWRLATRLDNADLDKMKQDIMRHSFFVEEGVVVIVAFLVEGKNTTRFKYLHRIQIASFQQKISTLFPSSLSFPFPNSFMFPLSSFSIWRQFHQHFTYEFFLQMLFRQLFFSYMYVKSCQKICT